MTSNKELGSLSLGVESLRHDTSQIMAGGEATPTSDGLERSTDIARPTAATTGATSTISINGVSPTDPGARPVVRVSTDDDRPGTLQDEEIKVGSRRRDLAEELVPDGPRRSDTPDVSNETPSAFEDQTLPTSDLQILPRSSDLPLSPGEGPSRRMIPKPLRTRDRGYSLRRSLFARNVRSPNKDNGSILELQPTASSSQDRVLPDTRTEGSHGEKSDVSTNVSPTSMIDDQPGLPKRSATKANGLSSLPHYENWARRRAARSGVFIWFKATYHKAQKTILRINETPLSKDGRHIDLDATRKSPLIDERTGRPYVDNTIRSGKYTAWNFLPRQLFAQFSKLANFYFLCISILQLIPNLSTTGTFTTIVPLLFFVALSMAKEGYEDLRRHRLDRAENNSTTSVLHAYKPTQASAMDDSSTSPATSAPKHWASTKWKDLRVGDIVKLERDEAAPADLALLHAQGPNGVAYIETMALDGETNLKSKAASTILSEKCKSLEGIAQCNAHLAVEDPNLDLYRFDGKISLAGETLPLTNNEIVYRGSVLRNIPEAIGMVIYTGEECKIRMNATKNPRIKAPALQTVVNRIVIVIVIFVLALAVFNTVAYRIWSRSTEAKAWYLTDGGVAFFPIFASFIIMFNTLIPLSLYVSLEIVKLFQMILLNDIDMYDEDSDTPMEARTSTINEELGQVSYIFSDKTGTLTDNSMRFRKMSVAGTAWLHDTDIQEEALEKAARLSTVQRNISKGKRVAARKSNVTTASTTPRLSIDDSLRKSASDRARLSRPLGKSSGKLSSDQRTQDLVQYIQQRPHTKFARHARFFMLSIALCHTCVPETRGNGDISFQATSPDESALVRAAQELGYILVDRHSGKLTIKTFPGGRDAEPSYEIYQILDVIEFSSTRKRMSIIVRMPNGRICLFCKGADSVIMELLRLSSMAMDKAWEVERRADVRRSMEAQAAIRRKSVHETRRDSTTRSSQSVDRPSLGSISRPSISTTRRLESIRDGLDDLLTDQGTEIAMSPLSAESHNSFPYSPGHGLGRRSLSETESKRNSQHETSDYFIDETLAMDDAAVFERCFQHINSFATEGLRTLLYGYRYIDEENYASWKKIYLEASTSLVDRQDMVERAGALIERDLELGGATAIEDKLQKGVPSAIEKLRRANIKLWMLTGDKRETAINIGHSCRLIKDYSTITILDHESGDVSRRIASTILNLTQTQIAHSVVVIDGQTLAITEADHALYTLFIDLAILVDTVICCRASPAQKANLVRAIRRKVKRSITLAIGDGANDIAMIQEAHVGIGITGKEGLQAARTSDYSIAQFRFLLKLLLVHGRWNYVRTCKYTVGTFWKEMLFYLTQALYQRYAGYTGTSLYESWSLSMFNTLFTSLPVIFMGIFEKDLRAETLVAVPELYTLGQRNGGFNLRIYLGWMFMASAEAMVVFFLTLALFGQALFTQDNSLFGIGALTYTACVVIIATKMQFLEIHNKSITCVVAMGLSIGGWFVWNIILSAVYKNNVIYNVKGGILERWGRNLLWWLTVLLIVIAVWAFEIGVKSARVAWRRTDVDTFQEMERDEVCWRKIQEAANGGMDGMEVEGGSPGDGEEKSKRLRTAEEEQRREGEVQELLDRPRVMRSMSGGVWPRFQSRAPRRHSGTDGREHETKHRPNGAGEDGDGDDGNDTGNEHDEQKRNVRQ